MTTDDVILQPAAHPMPPSQPCGGPWRGARQRGCDKARPPPAPAAPARGRHLALRLSLALLLGLCAIAWLAAIVVLRDPAHPMVVMVLAATLLLPAGLWVWANAAGGQRWALCAVVFVVVLVSDASVRDRAAGDTGLDAQSLLKLGVWVGALALWPWALESIKAALRTPTSALLFVFGLWATGTAVHSITPAYTFAAGISYLGIWTIAVMAADRLSVRQGLSIVMAALLSALALTLLLYVVLPDHVTTPMENGRVLRLSGLFGSPNNLGRAAALSLLLVAAFWGYGASRARWWFALLLVPAALACLYLSASRASLVALLVGLSILMAWKSLPLFMAACTLTTAGLLVALFLPMDVDDLVRLLSRTGTASELTTFTGRTAIWAWVLAAIGTEPWLGYGFASSRLLIPEGYHGAYGWTTTSAHNMWLQAWLTTGATGLALLIASQLSMLRDAVIRREPARDAIMGFVLVVGLMEAGPVGPSVNLLTFVWIWGAATSIRPGFASEGASASRCTESGLIRPPCKR